MNRRLFTQLLGCLPFLTFSSKKTDHICWGKYIPVKHDDPNLKKITGQWYIKHQDVTLQFITYQSEDKLHDAIAKMQNHLKNYYDQTIIYIYDFIDCPRKEGTRVVALICQEYNPPYNPTRDL